jgi:hypothetical protein
MTIMDETGRDFVGTLPVSGPKMQMFHSLGENKNINVALGAYVTAS